MFRKITALIIAALLSNGFTTYAQAPSAQEIKFKEKILEYGMGKFVKLKLQSNESLRGRITEIKNDIFEIQLVNTKGQLTEREIAYKELRKLSKTEDHVGKTAKRSFVQGVVGIGAVFGIVALLSYILAT